MTSGRGAREIPDPPGGAAGIRQQMASVRPKRTKASGARPGVIPGSEDAIARFFSQHHEGHFVFDHAEGYWRYWDGSRYVRDDTGQASEQMRLIARAVADGVAGDNPGRASARSIPSNRTIQGALKIAASDEIHARGPDGFDRDPDVINTPAGLVDLRTGRRTPHEKPTDHTLITGVAPTGDCPEFRRFVDDFCCGDEALSRYLQMMAGYALTGRTNEQQFFVLHGPGGNGKGVLIKLLVAAMGGYATIAPASTFLVTRGEQHPTGLARLRGKRLVVAQEPDRGQRWNESLLKSLVAGDTMSARFMRRDFFEFDPVAKILIACNCVPELHSPDLAMRRRMRIVPARNRPDRDDKRLEERLRAELPGILSWIIEGAKAWYAEGPLEAPTAVSDASDSYFDNQDQLGQWLDEHAASTASAYTDTRTLLADFHRWHKDSGERPWSEKEFVAALESRGFLRAKDSRSRRHGFRGIALRPGDE